MTPTTIAFGIALWATLYTIDLIGTRGLSTYHPIVFLLESALWATLVTAFGLPASIGYFGLYVGVRLVTGSLFLGILVFQKYLHRKWWQEALAVGADPPTYILALEEEVGMDQLMALSQGLVDSPKGYASSYQAVILAGGMVASFLL
jgi:hypothetical protein